MCEPAARAVATTDLEGVVVVVFRFDEEGVFVGEVFVDDAGILDGVFVLAGVLDLEGVVVDDEVVLERGVEGGFLAGVVEEGGLESNWSFLEEELGVSELDIALLPLGDFLGVRGDSGSSCILAQN
jgi:hypothetical protein